MADERHFQDKLDKTKKFLDAAANIADVGTKVTQAVEIIGNIFDFLSAAGSAFSTFGEIFEIVGAYLPDKRYKEILAKFGILEGKLDEVSSQLIDLEHKIDWTASDIQYAQVVRRINSGVKYLKNASEAKSAGKEREYQYWMGQLSFFSIVHKMKDAVKFLKNGLTGILKKNILEGLFNLTCGDRPELIKTAAILIQLLVSGMMVVVALEGFNESKDEVERYVKIYERELREVQASATREIQKCVDNFIDNLREDLRLELMTGDQNEESAERLMKKIDEKYDFKEMVVLIYNDIVGFDKHTFGGQHLNILHFNGKCGIIFCADKRGQCSSPQLQIAQSLLSNIAHSQSYFYPIYNANFWYDSVNKKIGEHRIARIATVVIKTGVDLCRRESSTASCNIVWEVGPDFTNFTYFVFL